MLFTNEWCCPVKRCIRVIVASLLLMSVWLGQAQADAGPMRYANLRSGKCLDTADHASGKGTFVVLNTCDKADKWSLVEQPNGTYLVVNARSGLCLNVYGGGKDDTTFIIQWTCRKTAKNNLWKVSTTMVSLPIGGALPAFRFVDSNSSKPAVPVYGSKDDGTFVVIDASAQPKYNDLWMPF